MHSSLRVTEMYPCLQGEGINLGTPSFLIRLHGCNLRCPWCDSVHTHTSTNGMSYEVEDIYQIARSHKQIFHTIITGGEPTLQDLSALLRSFEPTHSIEVETNGTLIPHQMFPSFSMDLYQVCQWNVSPKIATDTFEDDAALAHWTNLAQEHPKIFFKFVLRKSEMEQDLVKVLKVKQKHNIQAARILLMPEGTTTASQLGNQRLHDICLAHGFRYTPRLHVLIFGERHGV